MQLLAEARLQQRDKFNFRAFHDFVWKNGNVPIALQRWEYLGASDDLPKCARKNAPHLARREYTPGQRGFSRTVDWEMKTRDFLT